MATVIPQGFFTWLCEGTHLHPEEGDAGEQVHRGLEILQPLRAAGWEVVLFVGSKWVMRDWGQCTGEHVSVPRQHSGACP